MRLPIAVALALLLPQLDADAANQGPDPMTDEMLQDCNATTDRQYFCLAYFVGATNQLKIMAERSDRRFCLDQAVWSPQLTLDAVRLWAAKNPTLVSAEPTSRAIVMALEEQFPCSP